MQEEPIAAEAEESELVVAGEVVTTPASSENIVVVDAEPATPRLGFWAAGLAAAAGARARRALARAEPEPEGDQIVTVDAPPGTLGLVFKRDSTVLAKVLETSPLRDKVLVGWTLVSVDGEDVEMLNGWQTTRLLQAQAAAGRKLAFAVPARAADQPGPLGRVAAALSALSPRGRSGAAVPVVEVMEREAPTAGGAGEAVGSVEFLGLWNRENKKHSRLMPLKMEGGIWYGDTYDYDLEVRVALGRLVDKLVRNKARSGLLAIGNWTQMVSTRTGEGNHERTVHYTERFWAISWSARPDDERYQQLGLNSMQAPPGDIRFAGFDGVIGMGRHSPAKNAVYRVTLPSGGLDRSKWAGRPPPPRRRTSAGPRSDGLLSTDEISGEYSGRCFFPVSCCNSMTVAPVGPDVIEMRTSGCLCLPCFLMMGPWVGGKVRFRNPGTNDFPAERSYATKLFTFSADGTTQTAKGECCEYYKKRPGSQAPGKVETRDLAGTWCGCSCLPFVPLWPMFLMIAESVSGLSCTTKKVLNEDQYAELGCRSLLCLPIPVCDTRTRKYVNGHPTNGFAKDGGIDRWCCTLLLHLLCDRTTRDFDDIDWYHDPGYTRKKKELVPISFFAKKIG